MWDNLRIGIIGQGSQYKRISKILRSLGISFKIYKPSSDSNYYNKEEFNKLKRCNAIFILSPNNTHLKYIELLKDNRYLFCEKPPVNKINDLNKLKRIRSTKLYFNYNFRFSKISELLRESNKLNLNDLLYASIITGHGLGFKKEYPDSWRSNRKICKKGVFEIVSIHWVDLINYHFGIKKIEKINLRNYMKNSDGIDNSYCKIHLKNKSEIDIFSSYTSPLYQRMVFIFSNGIIEQNANSIEVRGPAMNLDKHGFFKKPTLIKKIKLNANKDYLLSLEKSVLYFLEHAVESKSFPNDNLKKSLISNSYVI